jgi:hypothetical protein
MPFTTATELQTRRVMATQTDYPKASIHRIGVTFAEIETILPFRVAFTNIGQPGYSPSNVPPIGIAIIGLNNYIL